MRRAAATATATATVLVLLLTVGASACGTSDDGATATTTVTTPTTETTETTTTTSEATTSTEAGAGLPSCQEVLQQYTAAFTPDDLAPVVALFRTWAPDLPDEVSAAVTRIADAYEEAGNLGELDMMDTDLSADAQTFSDWTSDGCPGR